MRRKITTFLVAMTAIVATALDTLHRQHFLSGFLPQPLSDWLPLMYIIGFTVALLLIEVKQPVLILDGVFAHHQLPTGTDVGVFVTNVGEKPAIEVAIDSIGDGSYSMSFEILPLVNPGGERKRIPVRYGRSVKNIFQVSLRTSSRLKSALREEASTRQAEMPDGGTQDFPQFPLPLHLTFKNADGRRYENKEFEFRYVDEWDSAGANPRYIIRRRDRIGIISRLRRGIGIAFENGGTRIAGPTKKHHS